MSCLLPQLPSHLEDLVLLLEIPPLESSGFPDRAPMKMIVDVDLLVVVGEELLVGVLSLFLFRKLF